jgi:hypothetical protein
VASNVDNQLDWGVFLRTGFLGVVRHGLTFGAGWLLAKGLIDNSDVNTVVGAGLALSGVLWSVVQKKAPAQMAFIQKKLGL